MGAIVFQLSSGHKEGVPDNFVRYALVLGERFKDNLRPAFSVRDKSVVCPAEVNRNSCLGKLQSNGIFTDSAFAGFG